MSVSPLSSTPSEALPPRRRSFPLALPLYPQHGYNQGDNTLQNQQFHFFFFFCFAGRHNMQHTTNIFNVVQYFQF